MSASEALRSDEAVVSARREVRGVILAAERGTRMGSELPNVLHNVAGRPMIAHSIERARLGGIGDILVVVGAEAEAVQLAVTPLGVRFVVQAEPRGTGHAVAQAAAFLEGFAGNVVVLYGDMPLLAPSTIRSLADKRDRTGAQCVALTIELDNPPAFGRIVRDGAGRVTRVVEASDASADELAIREVNVGAYCFDGPALLWALERLRNDNAQAEYYLTDVVEILVQAGKRVETVAAGTLEETLGVQDPAHLAFAEKLGDTRYAESMYELIDAASAMERHAQDPLTGLPNREFLYEQLRAALATPGTAEPSVAVLFLDVDNFKLVNDSKGHSLGDQLLVAIAKRLKLALRPGDKVARFGGDEFVVLCQGLTDRGDALAIADRIDELVSGYFTVGDTEVFVTASTGIAFADRNIHTAESLIRDADTAMYEAKIGGRSCHVVFTEEMRDRTLRRLELDTALRRALERDELALHYQPSIDLGSGLIVGVEALLRWNHPELGLLFPHDFMAIANDTGMIVPIGRWVIGRALLDAESLSLPSEAPPLRVGINIAGRQLLDPRLVGDIAESLGRNGIDPGRVQLEVTEAAVGRSAEAEGALIGLKSLGVQLALDDYGTDSSLSCLRRFPLDILKIDRTLIESMGQDTGSFAIVTALVSLAHTLGLATIGEGVETADQLAGLRAAGCDMAQGNVVAPAQPVDSLRDLIGRRPRW